MNLKQAFQTQAAIRSAITELKVYLQDVCNIARDKRTETHKYSDLNMSIGNGNNFEDEIIEKDVKKYNDKYDGEKIIALMDKLITAHAKMAEGISKAKFEANINIEPGVTVCYDAAITLVNDYRKILNDYKRISTHKADEMSTKGCKEVFVSAEVGSKNMVYEIIVSTIPDNEIVTKFKDKTAYLSELVDRISEAIEAAAYTTTIEEEYIPDFNIKTLNVLDEITI